MDCRYQVLACFYLEHESQNARFKRAVHQLPIGVHGEEHNRLTQTPLQQPAARVNTTEPRHFEIGYNHVRIQISGHIYQCRTVPGDPYHVKFNLEQCRDLAKQVLMIVG